jgi:diaminohydroxyphosphoribosylaminopyrimidine deaminase/5-amino-6-(5-phosphoribosylamino)uracil reductase
MPGKIESDPAFRFTDVDRAHMRRALDLAERGLFTTTPNPRVGCVLVRDGAVIGEGWHQRAGDPHAEVNALADARARGHAARGATAYVTLEPCNHTGRTPPCTEALLAAGLARVVIGARDPNPQAAHGAARLAAAGIDVETGLLAEEAEELNIGFVSRMTRGRPWVRLKTAASLDGRTALAGGESQWITGEAARADGHRYRARACAVLTGIGTILQDDPRLDVRAVATPRQPRRVIVDRHAQTPVEARVLSGGGAIVVTNGACNSRWPAGVEVLPLPDGNGRVDLQALMRRLADRGVNELHVEAGGKLNGALLLAGVVDELLIYMAPCLLGDPARGIAEFAGGGLALLADRVPLAIRALDRIGGDLRVIARVEDPG